ncbi:50S ribosomal protein L29 [bacterium]|nr:50S ribosomal protein L29 [bacterium]
MKKQAANYRNMSPEELEDQLDQLQTELFNLRVKNTTKELQDTSRIRDTRRSIARVRTLLGEMKKAQGAA